MDDDEPPLNEDDDDDDDLDDLDQGEDETSTHHFVLAQFDKVIMTAMSETMLLPACLSPDIHLHFFFFLLIWNIYYINYCNVFYIFLSLAIEILVFFHLHR